MFLLSHMRARILKLGDTFFYYMLKMIKSEDYWGKSAPVPWTAPAQLHSNPHLMGVSHFLSITKTPLISKRHYVELSGDFTHILQPLTVTYFPLKESENRSSGINHVVC